MDKVAQDKKTAFKVGFLMKLASLGITPQQLFDMVKAGARDDKARQNLQKRLEESPGGVDIPVFGFGKPFTVHGEMKKADILDPMFASGTRLGEQAISTGTDIGSTGLKYLAGLGLVAPVALGAGTGVAKTLLDAPTETDIETLQQAELAALYGRLTSEIRERTKHKALGA